MRNAARTLMAMAVVLGLVFAPACGPAEQETAPKEGDGSYGESMAEEHAGDEPIASGLAQPVPEDAVATRSVEYGQVEGEAVTGFLAEPSEGAEGAPGVIVIHEWWGLNDNIRHMAKLLAVEGYRALAVDLYGGETAGEAEAARSLMQAAMERGEQNRDNLRQAHAWLAESGSSSIGVIGWCFGGTWSLRAGLALGEDLDAVVVYYGQAVTDPAELEALGAPLLGIFGAEDQGIPVEDARQMRSALEELGKPATIEIYEGAGHAFANPSGTRYEPEAARDAWSKTLSFLDEHLGT
jgi:carboxymethylenebutenolidase